MRRTAAGEQRTIRISNRNRFGPLFGEIHVPLGSWRRVSSVDDEMLRDLLLFDRRNAESVIKIVFQTLRSPLQPRRFSSHMRGKRGQTTDKFNG